jgi:hypothetical protein
MHNIKIKFLANRLVSVNSKPTACHRQYKLKHVALCCNSSGVIELWTLRGERERDLMQ